MYRENGGTVPRIAFCITCKGRAQHVKQTLPRNLADNADYPNAVFVVLDYGSTDDLDPYLKNTHARDIAEGRVVVYSHATDGPFRMAHAKNMAHRGGLLEGAEILVNLDADNFTGEGFATYIAEEFAGREDKDLFLWARMQPGVLARGINGRIVVPRHAFLCAGGYDEKFETWSRDDKDFNERLRRLGFDAVEIDTRFLDGVRHSDKMRFREYPHVQNKACEDTLPAADVDADTTVVNFGEIGMGTVRRNFGTQPIVLNRLPTRIFGIGMHKTGTTSLHVALQMLGFSSAHWQSAHWAKSIFLEMKALKKSTTLEHFYALSDLPLTVLFKELDAAYPNSKFILTTRNEDKWVRSVKNHWNGDLNKYRSQWNTDPFTHTIHRELYGQKHFDYDVFLQRFRSHNAEVLEYFRTRPDDLLVLNIDKVANMWHPLCGFLQREVPAVDYPRYNGVETN